MRKFLLYMIIAIIAVTAIFVINVSLIPQTHQFYDISTAPRAELISFRAAETGRGPVKGHFLADMSAGTLHDITIDDPAYHLIALTIEQNDAQPLALITHADQYIIARVDLAQATFTPLFTSNNPLLDIRGCGRSQAIIIKGKNREGGVNRWTQRDLYRIDLSTGKETQLTDQKSYQAQLMDVDASCKTITYDRYDKDGDELYEYKSGKATKISWPDVSATNEPGSNSGQYGGDSNALKDVQAIRKGYAANGMIGFFKNGKKVHKEPYDYASSVSIDPTGTVAIQIRDDLKARRFLIQSYDFNTGQQAQKSLSDFKTDRLILRQANN